MRVLIAIPIYNEEKYLSSVLREVRRRGHEILVVNDGSTDHTPKLLAQEQDLHVITHPWNRGYGAALISAFGYAIGHHYDALLTMDCDGQHEPTRIPVLLEALDQDVDIVSGSRYLRSFEDDAAPPTDRQQINHQVTAELNARFGLSLTDSFCGFKAYSVKSLQRLELTELGYGMPLQLWVQAARIGLRIREIAIPRLYLDMNRAFGGALDNPAERLAYYTEVIEKEAARTRQNTSELCGR